MNGPWIWRKSSHSAGNGACAEVAVLPSPDGFAVAVRDSKNPGGRPELTFSPAAWMEFLAMVKDRGVEAHTRPHPLPGYKS